MTSIKENIKNILPKPAVGLIRRYRLNRLNQSFQGLNSGQIFDRIYRDGLWGRGQEGEGLSGGGSHKAEIVDPYVMLVKNILSSLAIREVVDLGCGDFNVGVNFVDCVDKYLACDVSQYIIQRNRNEYHYKNVEFRCLDITVDELPCGDIAFVRQVLQHLSNQYIGQFVNKLNHEKPYKYLVVTEHLPQSKLFDPNKDKPTGPGVRLDNNSGVVLHESPFALDYKSMNVVLEVDGNVDGVIQTILYDLT